jgi:hypothetical protein
MLYAFHGDTLPELCRDPVTSSFFLQIGTARETGSLTIIFPRDKTWERSEISLYPLKQPPSFLRQKTVSR